MTEEQVGTIGVDTGIVMVGDPCYHLHQDTPQLKRLGFSTSWQSFVAKLGNAETMQIGRECAVVVGGFGGDGTYPVFVRRDASGIITELVVKFNEPAE